MRPSTLLRIERLNTLVAALSVRDLGHAGVATLLRCSASSARNYVFELMDAGVIGLLRNGPVADGCSDKSVYRLNPNKRLVVAFQATLVAPEQRASTRANLVRRDHDGDFGCSEAAVSVANMVARRDPLVTALFGAPPARN